MSNIIVNLRPFEYFLIDPFTYEGLKVSEEEFFNCIGYDRNLIPMYRDPNDINRQNFYDDGLLIAYRVRVY